MYLVLGLERGSSNGQPPSIDRSPIDTKCIAVKLDRVHHHSVDNGKHCGTRQQQIVDDQRVRAEQSLALRGPSVPYTCDDSDVPITDWATARPASTERTTHSNRKLTLALLALIAKAKPPTRPCVPTYPREARSQDAVQQPLVMLNHRAEHKEHTRPDARRQASARRQLTRI